MQHKHQQLIDFKKYTDQLLIQLSEGSYVSVDTYTNNIAHLQRAYCELIPFIEDDALLNWLARHDVVTLTEIKMTGTVMQCLQNFIFLLTGREDEQLTANVAENKPVFPIR
ncbi:hypothetical protein NL54_22095 [Pantoea stewartii]|uniref:hypothetical protein n=1 Tax=Pantoea stewartii TaxID=66269 RepID=UPI000542B041|nr:hypothetical protein [Pantoea stewartii]KHD99219.1 hypothetical protein NL54_22095 [Pantoea stewartii]KHN59034.1 hypothetical protein OI73_21280 [Pantoea stewartii]